MLIRAVLISTLTTSAFALAVSSTPIPSSLPPLLQEVEAKYSKNKTLQADFQQTSEVASMGQKKLSSGRILIKKPGKVRWETLKPDTHLMVSDGARFWFYTPPFEKGERGQVIERKTSEVQSKLATALLVGSFSVMTEKKWGMKIVEKAPGVFRLTPKMGVAGTVEKIDVFINSQNKLRRFY